ncbi:hypothetical protein BC835DRAFT_748094 [Cytidiella melzeri]|nr:hypothetical protein BC835DRAFT_748094 [Cytidiella melzeri]
MLLRFSVYCNGCLTVSRSDRVRCITTNIGLLASVLHFQVLTPQFTGLIFYFLHPFIRSADEGRMQVGNDPLGTAVGSSVCPTEGTIYGALRPAHEPKHSHMDIKIFPTPAAMRGSGLRIPQLPGPVKLLQPKVIRELADHPTFRLSQGTLHKWMDIEATFCARISWKFQAFWLVLD